MKQIKVLHNKLLVKRELTSQHDIGGFVLPDASKKEAMGIGIVVQGVQDIATGSRIVFSKWAGTDVELDDKPNEYVILDPKDVMASL